MFTIFRDLHNICSGGAGVRYTFPPDVYSSTSDVGQESLMDILNPSVNALLVVNFGI